MGGNPMSAFDPKQTLRSLELLLTNQIPLPVAVGIIVKLNKEINAGLFRNAKCLLRAARAVHCGLAPDAGSTRH